MKLVRAAFDPRELFNPDKVFPTPHLCGDRRAPTFRIQPNSRAKRAAMSEMVSIAGVTPERALVPADRVELSAIVRDLYAAGKDVRVRRRGTELELGNPPRAIDTVVRTTALDRVIDYSPEDQTITVEAGMRIAALDAVLAEHNQLLPLETGDRRNATIGGAIATNAFGAQRHRYGSIKDLIVGIEFVRPTARWRTAAAKS